MNTVADERTLKLTLFGGLVIALGTVAALWFTTMSVDQWMFWLIWPAMLIHQAEENVFTEMLLGRKAGFLSWVRRAGFDISAKRALALNVGIGWTLAIASGCAGTRFVYLGIFVALVEMVNGWLHISATSLQQAWSPGTLSSLLITIPLAFVLVDRVLRDGLLPPWALVPLLLAAIVAHHLFLASQPKASLSDVAA